MENILLIQPINSTLSKYWRNKPKFKKRIKIEKEEPILKNDQITTLNKSLNCLLQYLDV